MPFLKKLFGKMNKDAKKFGGAMKKVVKPFGNKKKEAAPAEGGIGPSEEVASKVASLRSRGAMNRRA